MKPKLSIIVPIYNVEKFINRTVESLINQSLKDIEIILVDDGSTDRTGEYLSKYHNFDDRIRIFYKKNGGVSSARNFGLDMARGEYVSFLDGDDYVENDTYEKLYSIIVGDKSDIAVGSRKLADINGNINYRKLVERNVIQLDDYTLPEYIGNEFITTHTVSTCNKIYRRKIIEENKIWFKNNRKVGSEDTLFNIEYLMYVNKISSVEDSYTINVTREDSITNTYEKGCMKRTGNLMWYIKNILTTSNRSGEWPVIAPIIFQFLQQWNMDYIKRFNNNDLQEKVTLEFKSAHISKSFRECERMMATGVKYGKLIKKQGYRVTGRMYIRLMYLMAFFKRYDMVAKIGGIK